MTPITLTLINEGGYARQEGESVPHAELRCALERLEALEESRRRGNYMQVDGDPETRDRFSAVLYGDPTGGTGADAELLASLGDITVAPPHAYYTVVEADLAIEAGCGATS